MRIKSTNLANKNKINYLIASLVILLSILGIFVILSASAYLTIKYNTNQAYYAVRQGIFVLIGIVLMFLVSKIDYHSYKKHAGKLYIISIVLLLMALFSPMRVLYNGYARRGLKLGLTFMPSDIYKIASILFISRFLVSNQKNEKSWIYGFAQTAIWIIVPTGLILIQPDLSTSLAIIASLGMIYLLAGFQKKFWPVIVIGLGLAFAFFYFSSNDYQFDRFRAWLNPEAYAQSISWHVLHSLYAVSRGGLFGVGYGQSVLKFGYLSNEVYNDMIFAVIAEEFGLVGSMIFITLIFSLTMLVLREALITQDPFARNVLVGIGSIYFFQSAINIAVSLNMIPNTGITLPFISYGGTSLLVFFAMFGIVLNISRHNQFENKKKS